MSGRLPSLDTARGVLSEWNTHLSAENVLCKVANHFQVTKEDVVHSKEPANNMIRVLFVYLCRVHLHHSFPRMGRFLGHKDHTSTWRLFHLATYYLAELPAFRAKVAEVEQELGLALSLSSEAGTGAKEVTQGEK